MSRKVTRRQILCGLFASWFGLRQTTQARASAQDDQKPPCPHYYDGRLWSNWHPGQTGYYVHSLDGCPFCRSPRQEARAHVTTYVYDRTGQLTHGGDRSNHTTTYVYDARGRVLWTSSRRT
jgi:YD repeat-containing protein